MVRPSGEQLGEWLSAYVDGELDEEQTRKVEDILRKDEAARRLLNDLRRVVSTVQSLPQHPAPESIAADVQLHVERSQLLGDPDERIIDAERKRSPVWGILSTAAVFALVIGAGWYLAEMYRRGAPGTRVAVAPVDESEAVSKKERLDDDSALEADPGEELRGQPSTEKLLASANLEQKLMAGMGWGVVQNHTFENEPYRLQVNVRTAAERDAVTSRLVSFLSKQQLADASASQSPTEGASASAAPARFFFQGRANSNFAAANESQILLRASPRELEAVVDELSTGAPERSQIAFVSGPVTIASRNGIRRALRGMVPEEAPPAGTVMFDAHLDEGIAEAGGRGAADAKVSSDDFIERLTELIRNVGLKVEQRGAIGEPTEGDELLEFPKPPDEPAAAIADASIPKTKDDRGTVAETKGRALADRRFAFRGSAADKTALSTSSSDDANEEIVRREASAGSGGGGRGGPAVAEKKVVASTDEQASSEPTSLVESRFKAARAARGRASRRRATRGGVAAEEARAKSEIALANRGAAATDVMATFDARPRSEVHANQRLVTIVIQIIAPPPAPEKKARARPSARKREDKKDNGKSIN